MSPSDASYSGMDRQLDIYRKGLAGQKPGLPVSVEALREVARERATAEAFDYLDGGAGSEDSVAANLEAFRRWRIVPRMLRDVSDRDMTAELFGTRLRAPFLLAPIGVQGILHEEGELATARAASALDVPIVLSTVSSHSLEAVAAEMGAVARWFQLYWPRDRVLAESFVRRAEGAGYSAIVITLDAPYLAWRERDIQHAYLPFLHADGLANYFVDPVFRAMLARPPEEDPAGAIQKVAELFANPQLTWEDLPFLREATGLPILLKGILAPEDARRAVAEGVDGIIVSNHGGRQLDGAIAALDALPSVVEAAGGQIPVLFDSGIRRGADLLKAVALGAAAVLLGRPFAFGLAAGGEAGVRAVLENFIADADLTLALAGRRGFDEVDRSALVRG